MNTKPSTFDEEAYNKGLLGSVIRFGKAINDQYKGWAHTHYQDLGDALEHIGHRCGQNDRSS